MDIQEEQLPRHVQIFDEDINTESVQQLINDLNQYTLIDLYFSTGGGETVSMEALIHYLNNRADDVVIYLTGDICSAGTFLLLYFKGCIKITKNLDFILFHSVDRALGSARKGSVSRVELIKQLNEFNEDVMVELKKLGLTDRELKRFKSGHDVVLYRKDFHRLNLKSCD